MTLFNLHSIQNNIFRDGIQTVVIMSEKVGLCVDNELSPWPE